jgi:hypothetical protein
MRDLITCPNEYGKPTHNLPCFFFRDAANSSPHEPISFGRLLSFWLLMLDALQPKYTGTQVAHVFPRLRKIAVLQAMCEYSVAPALLKETFGQFMVKKANRRRVKECFANEYDIELLRSGDVYEKKK